MIKEIASASLPTRHGKFKAYAFSEEHKNVKFCAHCNENATERSELQCNDKEHIALVRCDHPVHGGLPVRIHSRCLTGDTLTSLRCDCRDQLEAAMQYLEDKKCGILIYLDQEGRGIGLVNKIKAYALQEEGMDTVEANVHLGFGEDLRDYGIAAEILKYFGIKEIRLLTNNPKKISDLEAHGIKIVERIPLITEPNEYNKKYLETKRKRMKHMLE
jgi:GTP cyclohydrolase II